MHGDHPRVITLPPALYAGAFALGLLLEYFWRTSVVGPALRIGLGAFLVLVGFGIMISGLRAFRAAGTNVEVYRPATSLVVTGPYQFSRNPIYVGMTMAYAGAGVLADSLWVLVLVIPVLVLMDYGVVRREEQYLGQKFGDAYRKYARTVRRWV